jgi:hypothetical protein
MNTYLWLVLMPNLCSAVRLITIVYAILCFFGLIAACDEGLTKDDRKPVKIATFVFLGLAISCCLFPDSTQIKQMLVVDSIQSIKGIDKIPAKTVELVNEYLEKELKELKGDD